MLLYAAVHDEPQHRLRLEEIYRAYCRQMLWVAADVLGDRHGAEDAVHDAFLGIARHMAVLSRLQEDEVRHYVLRAARNAAINRLRQRRELPLEDAASVAEEDFIALLCAREDAEALLAAMEELPEHYRDVLYYR